MLNRNKHLITYKLSEVEDEDLGICFDLTIIRPDWMNTQRYMARETFLFLEGDLQENLQIRKLSIDLNVLGHLGRNCRRVGSPPTSPKEVLRPAFRLWYTQAVQARAAVLGQLVRYP
jgi:hypothetical protein